MENNELIEKVVFMIFQGDVTLDDPFKTIQEIKNILDNENKVEHS
jgi:hypothetical protein